MNYIELKLGKIYELNRLLIDHGFLFLRKEDRLQLELTTKWVSYPMYLGKDELGHMFLVGEQVGYWADPIENLYKYVIREI